MFDHISRTTAPNSAVLRVHVPVPIYVASHTLVGSHKIWLHDQFKPQRPPNHQAPAPRHREIAPYPAQAELQENIKIRFAFGHTDAMMLPQITYKGKAIVYMADLLPSVGHIPLPYVMAYDMFPLQTLKEKKAFLEEAASNNYILYLEHDPINECCTLQHTEKGVRLAETFRLDEI